MKNLKILFIAFFLVMMGAMQTTFEASANDCLDRFAGNWIACTEEEKDVIKDLIESECGPVNFTVIFFCPDGSGWEKKPSGGQQRL
jgi:hypothetical protein